MSAYKVGQVVIFKGKKEIPLKILEITEIDGESFYRINRKNFLHEPMLRALNAEETGKSEVSAELAKDGQS